MKFTFKEFVSLVADLVPSDIPDDDGEVYISKFDKSYLDRKGLDLSTLQALYDRGITEQIQSTDHTVAVIGYNPIEKKWYGWSHRAIFGFGIGSECKKGKCHYIPDKGEWTAKTMKGAKQMAMDFAEGVG